MNWTYSEAGSQLEDLAKRCDTVITAAGTSLWDFLANGFPVATFPLVVNQKSNYDFVINNNLALFVATQSLDAQDISDQLDLLLNSSEQRTKMVRNCRRFLDFDGPKRLGELVLQTIAF